MAKTEFKINGIRFDRTPKVDGWYGIRMFYSPFNGWVTIGKARTVAGVREFAEAYMGIDKYYINK